MKMTSKLEGIKGKLKSIEGNGQGGGDLRIRGAPG
jgi:hypothetical protein